MAHHTQITIVEQVHVSKDSDSTPIINEFEKMIADENVQSLSKIGDVETDSSCIITADIRRGGGLRYYLEQLSSRLGKTKFDSAIIIACVDAEDVVKTGYINQRHYGEFLIPTVVDR